MTSEAQKTTSQNGIFTSLVASWLPLVWSPVAIEHKIICFAYLSPYVRWCQENSKRCTYFDYIYQDINVLLSTNKNETEKSYINETYPKVNICHDQNV